MRDVGVAGAESLAYRCFTARWQEYVRRDELEAALVGIEIDACDQVAGAMSFKHWGDARHLASRDTAWRIADDADLDGVGGDGAHLIYLVVVAVVGGDTGQRTFHQVAIPLCHNGREIVLERPKDLKRICGEQ